MMENTYLKKFNSLHSWNSTVVNQLKGIYIVKGWKTDVLQCPREASKSYLPTLFKVSFIPSVNIYPPSTACPEGEDALIFLCQNNSNH